MEFMDILLQVKFDYDFFQKFVPATVSLIITGLASVIIGVYLEKFKNRLTRLKYKIVYQPLATTSQNDYWGDIQVYYNGRLINHLNLTTVTIFNDSNRDLENLTIEFNTKLNTRILAHNSFYNDTSKPILLDDGYYSYYSDVLKRNQEDLDKQKIDPKHKPTQQLLNELDFIFSNKKFDVRVLNRKQTITSYFLIENTDGTASALNINLTHKSVKLEPQVDQEKNIKRTIIYTIIIGFIVFIIGTIFIGKYYSQSIEPIIYMGLLGLLYSSIGLGIVQITRHLKRFFN